MFLSCMSCMPNLNITQHLSCGVANIKHQYQSTDNLVSPLFIWSLGCIAKLPVLGTGTLNAVHIVNLTFKFAYDRCIVSLILQLYFMWFKWKRSDSVVSRPPKTLRAFGLANAQWEYQEPRVSHFFFRKRDNLLVRSIISLFSYQNGNWSFN